ncbi:hypothetical protein EJ05DRAFT_497879 [Pseudovirgaria hyperparasitica]|uniref:Uncharacterized protein n=1 Tax=Pseudovirgaria hyperparasitica TaxID=470096 RepID=A0A6A6WI51_9PEZI|nr:uncharacterized protein EJ05DRAFT_497879 [Pseudovirgaria hyperparasitica]KAF2761327.1 hypothetical protein EJ05DRAFT_497879 [Pseudovirgaria hyperparasitica]
METTPPPPQRPHTPPTPLHGPKYDSYEPYSPRRSSRVASQRKDYHHSQQLITTPPSEKRTAKRTIRASTPTGLPQSSQNLSPPSSPTSPIPQLSVRKPTFIGRKGAHHTRLDGLTDKSDLTAHEGPSKGVAINAFGMLPTPAKTPRKRAPQPQASLKGTARVLFGDRPATIEDAMPTPKKKSRGKNALSLGSFEELEGNEDSSSITIYTDSKERFPEEDVAEDNPFMTRTRTNGTARIQTRSEKAKGPKTKEREEMERTVADGEGLIYVFRGKSVFRAFDESNADDEPITSSDTEACRQAGATKRIARSSIRPRLLFPTDEERRARAAAANAADEEAVTDIEDDEAEHDEPAAVMTPIKNKFTALPTPRSSRRKEKKAPPVTFEEPTQAYPDRFEDSDVNDKAARVSASNSTKASPFDSWRRSKSGSRSPLLGRKGKRAGEPINGEASKRTRSASQQN